MTVTIEAVQAALKELIDANTGKDLISSKAARNIKVEGGDVSVDIELGYPAKSQIEGIRKRAIEKLKASPGSACRANVYSKVVAHAVQRGVKMVPGVKNIIAIASAKAASGNPPPPSTSRWRWPPKRSAARRDLDSSQPQMLAAVARNRPTASRWSRWRPTACKPCRSAS